MIAPGVAAALTLLRESQATGKPIDLVISDWNMTDGTGVDLVTRLRSDPKLARTPFILVTVESEPKPLVEALTAGADSGMTKPVTLEALREKLEWVWSKRNETK